ncbi:MAG TPA: cellulase family glycosylhydrolase [Solirubrobacteraceae bacterium]|nr:cellulase family glycosylhydrolase [Solirubrobacteraceae bacterium]
MLPRRHTIVLALALAAPAALPAAVQASPRQPVAFEAPRELLSFEERDRTLDEIRDFGVTNVRQLVYWRDFAPRPKSKTKPGGRFVASDADTYPTHTWDRLDALIQSAAARGIKVHLNLTGPVPRWATKSKKDDVTRPIPKEFQAWATAVGRRYGDQVATWSIWNEPNQPQFLMPQYRNGQPYSPGLYRRLYQVGVKGLKKTAANRGDVFLLGETSPRGNSKVVFPLDFFRRMLCLNASYKKTKKCGRLDADGYAHHAYTTAKGPRFVPHDRRDVTLGVLSRLEVALDRAGKAGALPRGLPIYLTEFGIQSRPDRIQGVSFPKQAAYLSIAEHMAYVNPRVRSFSQYLMSDDRPRASALNKYAGFESGLRTSKGRKKPAYKAFRLPLAVENYGATDVLWGLVRQYRQATTVRIEFDPKGKKGWRKLADVKTTGTGVYSLRAVHRAGQHYRVKWTSPDGKRYAGAAVRSY